MKKQHLWLIIAALIITNGVTLTFLLSGESKKGSEVVATIGNQEITRQEWLSEIELKYGKDVLDELVSEEVISQAGEKYDISISQEDIDREMKMMKTAYGPVGDYTLYDEEKLAEQIENSLILEELLTKDADISEGELERYYEENRAMFTFPDSYHISKIVVKTKEEAEQTLQELGQGSSFSVLAMERSIDEFTASQGGDAGFVGADTEHVSESMLDEISSLKPGEWSEAIEVEDGYVIMLLHEYMEEESYDYQDVKAQIRRQLAIEQMDTPVSARPFWDEAEVEWFYDETQ
ncbi:peptidyl-prolyl cis-trans isomerase [Bacillus mesophilum]|uniref:peptidylprolyl isomerase n=1 Tax=Bacillus mesophilum TaxID=1071718 RepID=A0A7V7RHS4_9BACI|nr:peptidyl-prolyl cis-trans isomerase [Bacillus mesophilum]KAB2329153.1 peptidylprolyl isomerase [Bacillus mesophilum]